MWFKNIYVINLRLRGNFGNIRVSFKKHISRQAIKDIFCASWWTLWETQLLSPKQQGLELFKFMKMYFNRRPGPFDHFT